MLPTPSTSHVPYDLIYDPAEDSFLFLDALSSPSEKLWLQSRFSRIAARVPLLLEVGPGSGVILAFLMAHARTAFGTHVLGLSIDVNPHAALATRMTVQKTLAEQRFTNETSGQVVSNRNASIYLSSLQGDLTTALGPGDVDILVFNPPYVPTDSAPVARLENSSTKPTFEESSKLLELSYAGGIDGMQVTNRLLSQVPEILSPNGVAYILLCRSNKPEQVKQAIRGWEGGPRWKWCAETVGSSGKTAGWEKLEIVRIWRL